MIAITSQSLIRLLQTNHFIGGMAMSSDGYEAGEFAGPINMAMASMGEALVQVRPCYHRVSAGWMPGSLAKVLGAPSVSQVAEVRADSFGGVSFWVASTQYWLYPKGHENGEDLWNEITSDLRSTNADIPEYGLSDR